MANQSGYIQVTDNNGATPVGWSNTLPELWDFAENNVFLGNANVTQNTLPILDPFIGGFGRVWCLQAPVFFEPTLRGFTQRLIERCCKGLSGISNYELQTTEITYGNTQESYTVPTGIKRGNNNFSLRFNEIKGGVFRNILKYWITGISDLGTGYGTYHGKIFDTTSNLKYSAVNHTAIMLYALTDNSGGAGGLASIEFACMWFGCFPTNIPNSQYEYTLGEHNTTEHDVQFYGVFNETNTINNYAKDMLEKSNFYKDNYDEFNIGSIASNAIQSRLGATSDSDGEVLGFEPEQKNATQYEDIMTGSGLGSTSDPATN